MGLAWPFGCMQHTTLGVRGLEGSPWGRRGLDGISCAFFPYRQNSSRERRRRLGKGGLHGLMTKKKSFHVLLRTLYMLVHTLSNETSIQNLASPCSGALQGRAGEAAWGRPGAVAASVPAKGKCMDSVRPSTLPRLVSRGIRKGWTWGNCARLQEKKRWVWHNDRRARALSFWGGGGSPALGVVDAPAPLLQ